MASTQDLDNIRSLLKSLIDLTSQDDVLRDEKARGALLDASRKLTAAISTPAERCISTMWSMFTFSAVRLAVALNLFGIINDAGENAITAAELADKCHAERALVVRILRALTGEQIVDEVGVEQYRTTPICRHLTIPSVLAGIIHFYDQAMPSAAKLPEYFKSTSYRCPVKANAGPFQFANNTNLNSYAYWNKTGAAENFNTFMAGKFKAPVQWQDYYPVQEELIGNRSEPVVFVDVGGGRGHELEVLKAKFPQTPWKMVLEDLPHVIDDNKGTLDESVELLKHDMFTPQPIKGARAYFLRGILHNWPDEDCRKILANIVPAMNKKSKILIHSQVLADMRAPMPGVWLDFGMMILHSGAERSEKQYSEIFESVGLKFSKHISSGYGEGVIEAVLQDAS
ncbi:MAG: hypothetical protein M1834_005043 [Cirrosporium novae-zelandiae]|nr:MAG: hypothetical protein M1834_005043 [Cirrosporium novae-zelandiae]